MAIFLTIGKPHHGKSLRTAKILRRLVARNYRWYKQTGQIREIWSNLKISQDFEDYWHTFIRYWQDPLELVEKQDIDVLWDEIARHMDARDWEKLPSELKNFIQEHDKVGIEIYANTQSVMQVDVAFRRLCERIEKVTKLFGSRRPSPTRPPVKYIWGLIWIQELEEISFSKDIDQQMYKRELFSIPHFNWIDRSTCMIFDTRQKIRPGEYPPLHHGVRYCLDPDCRYHKQGMVFHH